jgi:hypothetical protein
LIYIIPLVVVVRTWLRLDLNGLSDPGLEERNDNKIYGGKRRAQRAKKNSGNEEERSENRRSDFSYGAVAQCKRRSKSNSTDRRRISTERVDEHKRSRGKRNRGKRSKKSEKKNKRERAV